VLAQERRSLKARFFALEARLRKDDEISLRVAERLAALRAEAAALQADGPRLREEAARAPDVAALAAENDALTAAIAAAEAENARFRLDAGAAAEEIAACEARFAVQVELVRALTADLDDCKQKNRALKEFVVELEGQLRSAEDAEAQCRRDREDEIVQDEAAAGAKAVTEKLARLCRRGEKQAGDARGARRAARARRSQPGSEEGDP
jgi:chromosome segregation ATPase